MKKRHRNAVSIERVTTSKVTYEDHLQRGAFSLRYHSPSQFCIELVRYCSVAVVSTVFCSSLATAGEHQYSIRSNTVKGAVITFVPAEPDLRISLMAHGSVVAVDTRDGVFLPEISSSERELPVEEGIVTGTQQIRVGETNRLMIQCRVPVRASAEQRGRELILAVEPEPRNESGS